jgi:PAS domain-containing protein
VKFILLLLLLGTSTSVWAVHPADPRVVDDIRAQINNFEERGKKIVKTEKLLNDASGGIDPDRNMVAKYTEELNQLKQGRAALATQIIRQTIDAYGIKPDNFSAEVDYGKFKSNRASWEPKFGLMEMDREVLDQKGQVLHMAAPGPHDAITWANGDIRITPAAFVSPGYLASVIDHETLHYDQLTTPGRGAKMSPRQRELEGYWAMLGEMSDNKDVFKLTDYERRLVKQRFDSSMKRLEMSADADQIGATGALMGDVVEPEPIKAGGEADFYGRLDGLRGAIKESQDSLKKEHEAKAAEAKARKEEEQRRYAAQKPARDAAWRYLRSVVDLACSDPDEFTRQIGNKRFVGVNLTMEEFSSYSLEEDLGTCRHELLRFIDENHRGPVPIEKLLAEARKYRAEHPPFTAQVGTAVGEFFSSLGGFLKACVPSFPESSPSYGNANSGSSGNNYSDDSRWRSDPDPHDNNIPHDWPSLNSLRGISGGSF